MSCHKGGTCLSIDLVLWSHDSKPRTVSHRSVNLGGYPHGPTNGGKDSEPRAILPISKIRKADPSNLIRQSSRK